MEDLVGKEFGYLKVLSRSDNNKSKSIKWKCQCSCGNIKDVFGSNLKSGGTKSCGCKNKIEMIGKRFGTLEVLYEDELFKKEKEKKFICKCDCGNVKSMMKRVLLNNVKSCGCLRHLSNKKYNVYDLSGEYGIGWTSNTNEEFYFDLEDYDKIKDYCWRRDKRYGYIIARENYNQNARLHCIIMGDKLIDHIKIKNSKHDNRKSNLRRCTNQQNQSNTLEPSSNTSGHKGVVRHNNEGIIYWRAQIVKNPKQYVKSYSIKKYGDDVAYNLACEWVENKSIELYGEFSPYYKERNL